MVSISVLILRQQEEEMVSTSVLMFRQQERGSDHTVLRGSHAVGLMVI